MHIAPEIVLVRVSGRSVRGGGLRGGVARKFGKLGLVVIQNTIDVVELPNIEPTWFRREDDATDYFSESGSRSIGAYAGTTCMLLTPPWGASEGVMGVRNESW